MSITIPQVQKLLKTALNEAQERFVTKKHLEEQFQQTIDRLNEGVDTILSELEDMDRLSVSRFDRLEKIVDNWPAPSTIKDLMERVGRIERKLKMTEFV